MDKDNISVLAMAIVVVAIIVGVYFNSPGLNKGSSQQQLENVVSSATTTNGYNQNNKA
jgi:uncharacterized protein (UPF0333 family)